MHYLRVTDEAGRAVLCYLVLPDKTWFGGNSGLGPDLDNGPHVIRTETAMLALIGQLANTGKYYRLEGGYTAENGVYFGHTVLLQPEMRADDIARCLDIDAREVVAVYRLLVRVTDAPDDAELDAR